MYIKIAKFNFSPYINLGFLNFFCIFVTLHYNAITMKILKDKERLHNLSYKKVFVIIPNEQYDELKERVKAFNKCHNLTCNGRFEFIPSKKIQRGTPTLHPNIADRIGDNNLFVRLQGGINNFFRYGYGLAHFNANADVIEDAVAEFVKEICEDTISLIDVKIHKLSATLQENREDVDKFHRMREIYVNFCKILTERGVYKKVLSAATSPSVQISIKNTQVRHYRKTTVRYGIEISVNDTKESLYIGDKTQTLLYMAALIRFKMGRPLYLHELYRNSHGSHSIYKREKTYQWLALIYKEIFGQTGMFEEWANPLRNGVPQPRPGHDFNQAKSGLLNKLKDVLSGDLSFAVDSCCLNIATDDNKDTYYTFNCAPEDIILDETAQKLSILFKKLYSLRD